MALPDQGMVQSNFGMEEQRPIAGLEAMFGQGLSQNNRVGGMQRQNDAQPIQGNNRAVFDRRAVFDVSGPIRARGGSNPIEQFLATLNPVQREQFLALPPEQQQAYASGGAGVPAQPNTVDPVLQSQGISETITDPLVRSLYFGSEGTPGFYNQLQQAGANLIGSDVPLQQTAGLDPLENQARQRAQAGLGAFQPYFTQQQDLINQAIGQSKRAQELQDPYFARAESQYGLGLNDVLSGINQSRNLMTGAVDRFGNRLSDVESRAETAAGRFGQDLAGIESGAARDVNQFGQALGGVGRQAIGSVDQYGNRLGESENLLRGTLGGYDPSMTQQFYNPYEDRVVQQTIDDVMKAGDQQDIAARAQAISSGGESAFGSRARLGAEERREALGRGLGDALSNIRSRGFSEAQQTGMGEFARQRDAERAAASGLGGFAGSRLGAEQQLGGTLRGLSTDQLAAQQGLSNRFTSGAQSRLAADQGVIDLLGRTGQQQFAAQQGLAGNLQQYGQSAAGARSGLASGLLGIGAQMGAGASQLGSQLAGYGGQMAGIGQNLEALNRGQRSELAGYGADARNISDMQNQRQYLQQLQQQMRPLQTMQQIGSMLPGYQQAGSTIQSAYGMAPDPNAQGLGAAFAAYGALVPNKGN
jgi:hypothetical protein